MDKVGIKHKRDDKTKAWMKKEIAEQKKRYKSIVANMDAIASKRDKWVADFLKRIQKRGFNPDRDVFRIIKPEEIPTQPKRKFKVSF